jgi:hypothetical protein
MFVGKARGLPKSGAPDNIGLGWKSLSGTNTLAYCEHSYITAVKSLITFIYPLLSDYVVFLAVFDTIKYFTCCILNDLFAFVK